MISLLKNWQGTVEVNGKSYSSVDTFYSASNGFKDSIHIKLCPKRSTAVRTTVNADKKVYRIKVKKYMTQKGNPQFDFMTKWNNDNPMPLRMMVGTIEKETRGMVYMKLHGDILSDTICMKCGRKLTNPVSKYFGIGPECGNHNYVNPFNNAQELEAAVKEYRQKLVHTEWEGWVIKSAIEEKEEYNESDDTRENPAA